MTALQRILLTNDDGIDSKGLRALERAFARRPEVEVWTVAPDRGRSACSHGLTLARPILVKDRGERRFAIDGLPADCVYLGLFGLMPQRPAVVVSGLNHGANLGQDVLYSGTVAGAREAAIRGVHGIAVSLVDWSEYSAAADNVVELALAIAVQPTAPPLLLNVNYPGASFSGPRFAPLGSRTYPECVTVRDVPGRNRPYYWLGGPAVVDEQVPGTDGWLIGQGIASATLLTLEQTDAAAMEQARQLASIIEPLEVPQ